MNPIHTFLQSQPFLILDGAMATELERRGADLRDSLWSAKILRDAPEMIRDVHLDYFRAGADVAITASYQATIEGFTRRGLSRATAIDLIQKSVHLAQEAREIYLSETHTTHHISRPTPLIAASIGPYGAYLADGSEYRGDYTLTEDELIKFHRPRMAALIAAEPDLLACETIPCLLEARALVRLLARFPNTYAWFTFTARDDTHTSHGEPLAECAAFLDQVEQVAAIGINCTAPKYLPGLIREIRTATAKPIIVYPNSGETYDPATKTWLGETDCDAFGAYAREWYAAGAQIIGGCCRTTPEHIQAIRQELETTLKG
ncbi:MAG TPA: homocysteine S-methyltransferase [Anaerolineales bacterium]|nr:homocysteine S-methyltransferase [Anaerolineales bacterium]